jgi:AcrR family transcriptional regulator
VHHCFGYETAEGTSMAKRKGLGRRDPEARRQAILDAGLAVFAAQGFAATKLDDVAEKAGVAKGTIYLHFQDKQNLFEQIVLNAVAPVITRLEGVARVTDLPAHLVFKALFDLFRTEVLGTSRKHILRLVITEGARFPAIANFYHREVVSRGVKLVGELLRRAEAKGELSTGSLAKFPQLVFAPLLMAVIWDSLFARIEPLDVEALLATHRELLLGSKRLGEKSCGAG